MSEVALSTDPDLLLVAREPRHPALWLGLAAQLTTLAVVAVGGGHWYDGLGSGAPWWVDFAGAPSALLVLLGGLGAAWVPRRGDTALVEGAPWLRAFWQVVYVTGIGLVLTVGSLFTDGATWASVLLISAGLATMFLGVGALLLVVGPVVILTDVRRPGVRARWYDVGAAAAILPWLLVSAVTLTAAVAEPVARPAIVATWSGVVLGTVEARSPALAWLLRAVTFVLVVVAWRVAVVSRRAIATRGGA